MKNPSLAISIIRSVNKSRISEKEFGFEDMKKSRKIKWTPALPLKRPDTIKSSEYTNSKARPFVPSYEKEEVNMFDLLSMQYAKIWLEERTEEKQISLSSHDSDFLVRRHVIRGLLLRKKQLEKEKPFKMKKFMNVPSRIKIRTKDEIDVLKSKLNDEQIKEIENEAGGSLRTEENEKADGSKDVEELTPD